MATAALHRRLGETERGRGGRNRSSPSGRRILVLSPDLIMRKDINRVVIYPKEYDGARKVSEDFTPIVLHPNVAIIISLFNGKRTEGDVAKAWHYLVGASMQHSREIVSKIIQSYEELFVSLSNNNCYIPYNPKDFVIKAAEIDLSGPRLNIPTSMLFIPTLRCSRRCIYCYAEIKRREASLLPLSRIHEIIQECKELKFGSVSLSGGEPFLHKDIFTILKWLRDAGFHPQIPTKHPLTKKQIYRLKDLGFDSFQLSIDSLNPDVLSCLTGTDSAYFLKITKMMKYVKDTGLKLSIVSVVTTYNINDMVDTVKGFAKMGNVFRIRLSACGRSIYRKTAALLPSYDEYQRLDEQINKLKGEFPGIQINLSYSKDPIFMTKEEKIGFYKSRPFCSAGRWAFVLLPNGKVTPCEELYYHPAFIIGDLEHQSILEMWNSEELHNLLYPDRRLFKNSPCGECEEFHECHAGKGRCWKRALIAYGEPNFPDPYCPRAPEGSRIC